MARFNTQPITGSVTAGGTLAALTQNGFIQLTGTAPYTLILPSPVLYPGFNQTFYNATSGVVTLTTPANVFTGAGGSGTATVTVPTTSTINLVSDGVNYIVVGEDGTSLTATTGSFSGNVTINGASATLSVTPQTVTIAPGGASTIDNVAVGATTRGSGAFTSLTANAAVTFTAGTASSTTGSGSLVVSGGIGVSGNINSGGTVAAVALSGPLTGTLQTAAQANITSVGTLTSLNVGGVIGSNASSTGTLNLGETGGGATYVAASIIGTASTLYAPVGKLSFRLPTHGANTDYGLTEQMFIEGTGADSRGAYKLVILPFGGQVGIGTTTPATRLSATTTRHGNADGLSAHLNAIQWEVSGQGYTSVVSNISSGAGNYNAGLLVKLGSTDVTDKILDLESGGVNRVRVLGNGNVGIGAGATTPANKVQIGSVGSSGYSGNDLAIGNGTQVMSIYMDPAGAASFYTNTRFAFLPSGGGATGYVGIGTTSPVIAFQVDNAGLDFGSGLKGNAILNDTSAIATGQGGGIAFGGVYTGSTTTQYAMVSGARENASSGNYAGALILSSRPSGGSVTERLRINSGGDIVFGNGAAGVNRQFTINGSINKASRIIFQESGVDRWLIGHGAASENGNFEIYSANGNNFSFTRAGNFTAAGTVTANSDITLKTNVTTITNSLDKVLALRGVMFDRISTGNHEMGVIAQEVELVVPELVITDENGIKSVAYGNTVALLIEAVKEQQLQIEQLKKRLV